MPLTLKPTAVPFHCSRRCRRSSKWPT